MTLISGIEPRCDDALGVDRIAPIDRWPDFLVFS
jgi:hypothetical protein